MGVQVSSEESQQHRKALRKAAKTTEIEKKKAAKQNNLKQQWLEWAKNFKTEEEALAEGIYACEKLARDLEVVTRAKNENEYLYFGAEQDEDLMRMVQFDELKTLWIRRNQPNILTIKKLSFSKPAGTYKFGYTEFWEDTFFSYLEDTQLYVCEVKLNMQQYELFFSNLPFKLPIELEVSSLKYGKTLDPKEKQAIGQSFGKLVPVIEYGARNFWRHRWSKVENKLLPEPII